MSGCIVLQMRRNAAKSASYWAVLASARRAYPAASDVGRGVFVSSFLPENSAELYRLRQGLNFAQSSNGYDGSPVFLAVVKCSFEGALRDPGSAVCTRPNWNGGSKQEDMIFLFPAEVALKYDRR